VNEIGDIKVDTGPSAVVVYLSGDITIALREAASAALAQVLQLGRPLLIDARAVTSIDAAGLAFLLQVVTSCEQVNLPVCILDPAAALRELLAVLGLDRVVGRTS
jgi:anti-anti-sigma factor